MGVVEHSLGDRKLKATVRKLLQRGWRAYASPSLTVGRPVGGAALLVNDKLAESFTGFTHGNGYSFASCFVRLEDYEVLVVAMYLKSREDLESPTNSELLKELTCLLRMVSTPWMVMADWNQRPERLKEHWILEAVKGEMVLTGEATISTGNELDYLVVSKHLHGWVGTVVDMEVPWSPHYGIQICLRQRLRQFEFLVMNRFKVIPPCLGPRLPWRCFYRPHMSIMLPGQLHEVNHEETLDQKFADFVAQFEMWKYSTVTDVDEEDLGRGRCLQLVKQCRVREQVATEVWSDRKVGFWMCLLRWVQDCLRLSVTGNSLLKAKLWRHIQDAVLKLPKYWREPSTGMTLVSLQHGLRTLFHLNECKKQSIVCTLEQLKAVELQQVRKEQKAKLEAWQEQATKGNAKLAHQYLKKPDELPERPYQLEKIEDRPGKRREYWKELWGESPIKSNVSPAREELKRRAIEQAAELKPISSAQIVSTLEFIPSKKEGADGLTFKDLKNLPPEGVSNLTWFTIRLKREGNGPGVCNSWLWRFFPRIDIAKDPLDCLPLCIGFGPR